MVSSINMGSNEQREPCAAASGMYMMRQYICYQHKEVFSAARCISIWVVHNIYFFVYKSVWSPIVELFWQPWCSTLLSSHKQLQPRQRCPDLQPTGWYVLGNLRCLRCYIKDLKMPRMKCVMNNLYLIPFSLGECINFVIFGMWAK